MKKVVIALGGNALQARGEAATSENQLKNVMVTAEHIAKIIGEGYKVIVSHGNGPQVGRILLQNEAGKSVTPPMPMDVCGAMTQGMIGYHIQQGLSQVLRENGIDKPVCTLVTQVEVDSADPAFQNPTKPVGAFYTEEEAMQIQAEKGYAMKKDANRGYRRVVPSPKPQKIIEIDTIKPLVDGDTVVVAAGGGGIPVYNEYITDVIIAVIVYMAAFSLIIKMWIAERQKKRAKKAEQAAPAAPAAETPAEKREEVQK